MSGPILAWARAMAARGRRDQVRETLGLTIGAGWSSDFILATHTAAARAAARAAGLSSIAIEALRLRTPPADLPPDATAARRLACALMDENAVDDGLYAEARRHLSEADLLDLLALQYLISAMILALRRPPTP